MSALHVSLEKLPAEVNTLRIAFSGGVDSSVLLDVLQPFKSEFTLSLWHINYGVQQNADEMERFALNMASFYQIECQIEHLDFSKQTSNFEALARHARYDLFKTHLKHGEALLTAHHQNDQAETLLLNLMRGSGGDGLRGIHELQNFAAGYLYRPLLNVNRSLIEQYAEHHKLKWVEDQSNQDLGYDRNYIRHQVLPEFNKRWPSAIQQLSRAAAWQKEQQSLLIDLAEMDYQKIAEVRPYSEFDCLKLESFQHLSKQRQKNLIRYWLKRNAKQILGFKKLEELVNQLQRQPGALMKVEGQDYAIQFYQGFVYLCEEEKVEDLQAVYPLDDNEQQIAGFSLSRKSVLDFLNEKDNGQEVRLHFRSADVQVDGEFSHRLKRLFQKHHVPPWIRGRIPQIYINGELEDLLLL